jgi:hypothetical protein
MTHIGNAKWNYSAGKMTPKQFNKLNSGDLLSFNSLTDLHEFIPGAWMLSVFDTMPHAKSAFLVTEVSRHKKEDKEFVSEVHAHYMGANGNPGHAIISPHFIDGFSLTEKEK